MQPVSPQVAVQLFLMVQEVQLEPTKKTAWLMFLAQLSKMPLLQRCQLEASTLTATGLLAIKVSIYSHPLASAVPKGLYFPPQRRQESPVLAVYGYYSWVACPKSLTYQSPLMAQPPLHPWFSQGLIPEQSTSCCQLKSRVAG